MEFMVQGSDGKEYGPVNLDSLKAWVAEGRVNRDTMVRDFSSGQTMKAGSVSGLFVPTAIPATVGPIGGPGIPQTAPVSTEGPGELLGVIGRSVLAVVLFFVFHGLGLLVAGYALFYAIQCKGRGSKYGTLAIVIASVALVLVGVGWILRLQGTGV